MTLRWDLLLPTKTTLIRERDPTLADADYDYAVIWVNKLTNSAWLLKDSTMQVLPPTSGTVIDIATEDTTTLVELETSINNLQQDIDDLNLDNVITSEPTSGQYQINELALDADKKIIVTHNDTAE